MAWPGTRRLALRLFDLAFIALGIAVAWVGMAVPAAAYVDPSVMTYTIQALAGVAVALSAVIGVAWRRLRRVVLCLLKVDENAGKAVETAVSELPAAKHPGLATAEPTTLRQPDRGAFGGAPLAWRKRFLIALIATVCLCLASLFFSPLVVVVTGASSLSFSLGDVWLPLLGCCLACSALLALVLSALPGKAFDVALGLVAAVCVAAVIQELALNGFLPAATGQYVDWSSYNDAIAASVLVWLLVCAAFMLLVRKRALYAHLICPLLCIVIMLAQGINLGVVVATTPAGNAAGPVVTEEGLTTVSSKSNVIVFILDMFDTDYMDQVVEQYPEAASELTGFTWYHNATGSIIPTRYGVPYIVTGKTFDTNGDVFTTEELKASFSDENLLDEAAAQGYSVGVYSDSVGYGLDSLANKTMNVHELASGSRNVDILSCASSLFEVGLYRDLPAALKPYFWFTTDSLNAAMCPANSDDAASTPYLINDMRMHTTFSNKVLEATDDSEGGAYRVIHLQGSHWPYVMNENGEAEQLEQVDESQIRQSAGSLSIVSEYISQLKELGVYDNSTIVITADHGRWDWNHHTVRRTTNPIMLVKPAGADSSRPLQVSEAATGHVDLPATLEWAIGAAPSGPTIMEATGDERKRCFLFNDHDGHTDKYLVEYEIDGDANDFSNWRETGRCWPIKMEGYE